jgi:hypothetical protein
MSPRATISTSRFPQVILLGSSTEARNVLADDLG